MPHMPKARLTEKDMKATMSAVREAAVGAASAAVRRDLEAKKQRAVAYKDLKVKEILLDAIITKIDKLKSIGIVDMYDIVGELSSIDVMNEIVSNVDAKIADYDSNNEKKINSTNISLTKTIEREYKLYMIELLVRSEVENMKSEGVQTTEIIGTLNLDKKQGLEEDGKELRRRVRAVVKTLYGVPDKEQRIDKLREETRTIMRNIASDLEFRQKEDEKEQGTTVSNPNPVGDDSDPDASDR